METKKWIGQHICYGDQGFKTGQFFFIRKNGLVRSGKLVTAWQPVTVLFIRSYKPTGLNQKIYDYLESEVLQVESNGVGSTLLLVSK